MELGMNQKALDIVRNMLADGVDINLIMKYAGLTQETEKNKILSQKFLYHIYDINFLISSWVNPVISMMVFSSIPFAIIFFCNFQTFMMATPCFTFGNTFINTIHVITHQDAVVIIGSLNTFIVFFPLLNSSFT